MLKSILNKDNPFLKNKIAVINTIILSFLVVANLLHLYKSNLSKTQMDKVLNEMIIIKNEMDEKNKTLSVNIDELSKLTLKINTNNRVINGLVTTVSQDVKKINLDQIDKSVSNKLNVLGKLITDNDNLIFDNIDNTTKAVVDLRNQLVKDNIISTNKLENSFSKIENLSKNLDEMKKMITKAEIEAKIEREKTLSNIQSSFILSLEILGITVDSKGSYEAYISQKNAPDKMQSIKLRDIIIDPQTKTKYEVIAIDKSSIKLKSGDKIETLYSGE